MTSHIRIGNQTAFSASRTMEPLEFAVERGFKAFEWFVDKKFGADGSPAGWDETDMDQQQRDVIRRIGESHDILYTVHAPWQANPLHSRAERLLKRSVDFARDIGADLVNLHLYMDRGAQAYVEALTPIIAYAADSGVRLSIENTPLTGPADFNDTFTCLGDLAMDTEHVGMCLDIGHANLFSGTHHDYIRYIDELAPQIPIIHLHVHENWGDRDSHLTLFTGPAQDNDAGVRACLERLRKRRFGGAMILEQWPQPPELLVTAERHLKLLLRPTASDRSPRAQKKDDGASSGEDPEPHPVTQRDVPRPAPQDATSARIAAAHDRNASWRQRLGWIRDLVSQPEFAATPEQLAALAVYLRFLGTGELACEEDGHHFRPHHHAGAALAIEQRLEAITVPEHNWILRKIHPWLPSYDRAFQRSEPLTRIRDIAHRNDIPKALKREIKQRLQNKLHRCAGPEDLETSREILERITAPGTDYASEFVAQFQVFHQELSEFFNASSLDQRLEGLIPSMSSGDGAPVRSFLRLKANRERSDAQLLKLLEQLTGVRERLAGQTLASDPEKAQQMRLADIGLEDYAFALLSEAVNRLDNQDGNWDWGRLLRTFTTAVANVRLSHPEVAECTALLSELRAWTPGFDPTRHFHLLRLKATLERIRRLAEDYSDRILALFPPLVTDLGQALGVAEHAIRVFCEGDIRGNLVFQLTRLTETCTAGYRRTAASSSLGRRGAGGVLGPAYQVQHPRRPRPGGSGGDHPPGFGAGRRGDPVSGARDPAGSSHPAFVSSWGTGPAGEDSLRHQRRGGAVGDLRRLSEPVRSAAGHGRRRLAGAGVPSHRSGAARQDANEDGCSPGATKWGNRADPTAGGQGDELRRQGHRRGAAPHPCRGIRRSVPRSQRIDPAISGPCSTSLEETPHWKTSTRVSRTRCIPTSWRTWTSP